MNHDLTKQFVIQQHTTPDGVHWDLMLEMGDLLWTWRLNVPPAEMSDEPIAAERIADHPLRFLTYEGPVQNNTGHVAIADKGTYNLVKQTENTLLLEFQGKKFKGLFSLEPTENVFWTLQAVTKEHFT